VRLDSSGCSNSKPARGVFRKNKAPRAKASPDLNAITKELRGKLAGISVSLSNGAVALGRNPLGAGPRLRIRPRSACGSVSATASGSAAHAIRCSRSEPRSIKKKGSLSPRFSGLIFRFAAAVLEERPRFALV
jgi:hypothetical protein